MGKTSTAKKNSKNKNKKNTLIILGKVTLLEANSNAGTTYLLSKMFGLD